MGRETGAVERDQLRLKELYIWCCTVRGLLNVKDERRWIKVENRWNKRKPHHSSRTCDGDERDVLHGYANGTVGHVILRFQKVHLINSQ
jgi:hypothetical protein